MWLRWRLGPPGFALKCPQRCNGMFCRITRDACHSIDSALTSSFAFAGHDVSRFQIGGASAKTV